MIEIEAIVLGKKYIAKIADRETVMAIRDRARGVEAINPHILAQYRQKPPTAAELRAYGEKRDKLCYWAYQQTDVAGMSSGDWSEIAEKIGDLIVTRLIRGPEATRPVTIDDLTTIIGQYALADGDIDEKAKAILDAAEKARQHILSVENAEDVQVAEADLNGDPTQAEI